jgi:hypothetical protein
MVRASGGPISSGLQLAIKRTNNTPIDEGPGESYHRSTNQEAMRAPARKNFGLISNTRHEQNIALVGCFLEDHGEQGANVFRFEWFSFKRVLPTHQLKKWAPVRMNDSEFFKRLYKLDDSGDDWNAILLEERRADDKPDRKWARQNKH